MPNGERFGRGDRRFRPLPIARSATRDRRIVCPKGIHDLLVDVPESVIVERDGERVVPREVVGLWPAWCEKCDAGSWFEKEQGELLIVKGKRRDIPTTPSPESRTEDP